MAYSSELTAQSLRRWERYLDNFRLPKWEDIPNFGLYMEQVIDLLRQYLDYLPPELKEEQLITAAAINNYVRTKVMPMPIRKRYYREHIAYLIIILTLKQGLSIALIHQLIPLGLSTEEVERIYTLYANRHAIAADYFKEQVKTVAAPILYCEADAESSASETAALIAMSAVISGFARLLAERLLMLDATAQETAAEPAAMT